MMRSIISSALLVVSVCASSTASTTVGDLVRVRGIRDNHLVGLGLVVGLNGTGDTSSATREAVRRFGATCGFDAGEMGSPNAALVVLTAEISPFLHEGARVDVSASAQGDATSLSGGTLISTPLWAGSPDNVYLRAQGTISNCQSAQRGAVGTVRGGGIVERQVPPEVLEDFTASFNEGRIVLDLARPSLRAAAAVAEGIALIYGKSGSTVSAKATSPGEVVLAFGPIARENAVRFLADVLATPVEFVPPARIVINERTGTIAASGYIEVAPAAVTTGALSVTVGARPIPDSAADASATGARPLVAMSEGMSIQRLVQELNRIKVSTKDLIAVLNGLVEVGAVRAEIVVE
jgi:flagellar P-ring protein precursor FlgI